MVTKVKQEKEYSSSMLLLSKENRKMKSPEVDGKEVTMNPECLGTIVGTNKKNHVPLYDV